MAPRFATACSPFRLSRLRRLIASRFARLAQGEIIMGRKVRRVPANWQHPKDRNGRYIPLFGCDFDRDDATWNEEYAKWQEGFVRSYSGGEPWEPRTERHGSRFTDWHGQRPSPDDYMPNWPEEQRTHLMMYEDTSEGTPISPAFKTPEELARWLADNGASSFADMTASYEQWLAVARGGWAPSMVIENGRMASGVEFIAASVDTHPAGGDAVAAPFMSGAVPPVEAGDAQNPPKG